MGQTLLNKKSEPPLLKSYSIKGLHYFQDFHFKIENNILIVVGESGWGKTTILYLLYLTLKQLWLVLVKQRFDFITIELNNGSIVHFSKSELEYFILLKYLRNKSFSVEDPEILIKFDEIEKALTKCIDGEVLYFPVYRDLKDDLITIGKDFRATAYSRDFLPEESRQTQMLEHEILIPLQFQDLLKDILLADQMANAIAFANICNSYLDIVLVQVIKERGIVLLNKRTNEEVDLTQVSSGEKQILYFFGKLFFTKSKNVVFLVDEPELSISIDWQRRLLIDVVNYEKTKFMMAITHSPYIFDNDLDTYAIGINSAINKF
jgi:predicted ATP-dependent endonuclease of OLD family